MKVKYTFDDDCTLKIEYIILSDSDTVANPTNHAYFNLSGDSKATVENHLLQINADHFTETDDSQLPTGELGEVKGTMMDFTSMHKIGDKIDEPFRAIIDGIGYDNNYCLNKNRAISPVQQSLRTKKRKKARCLHRPAGNPALLRRLARQKQHRRQGRQQGYISPRRCA